MKLRATKKILSFTLVLALVATSVIGMVSGGSAAALAKGHYSLEEAVELFSNEISGENQVLNTGFVYRGWRTSNGNWLKGVMNELKNRLVAIGFDEGERTTANNKGDSVWYQVNANAAAWNPQYVSVKIAGEPGGGSGGSGSAPGPVYSGITDFRKAYPSFEASATLTEAERDLCVDVVEFTADCIDPTSIYYPSYVTPEFLYNSLANPGSPEYAKMQEVNKRVHLPTNMSYFAYTDETLTPAENIAKGTKTGQVVYVGTLTATTNSLGIPAADLAGKVLLTTTTASANVRTYVQTVGAVAALCRVSSNPGYRMPVVNGERWYTDYVPYTGAGNWAEPGTGGVALHWSLDGYDALMKLMEKETVVLEIAVLGTYQASVPREMLVAEIQGATKPHERIYVPAHINEPGAHDNASGVAMGFEIVTALKRMIDTGRIARPERTITFVWGDEITMTDNWEAKYRNEFLNVKGSIDLDMTGGDPVKIGGNMLIEKTPDPSDMATNTVSANLRYRYGNFTYPGQTGLPLSYNVFVREPDKFSLWTGGTSSVTTPVNNYPGFFLNDLYLQTGLAVQELHAQKYPGAPLFEVESNPYEGGSDHSPFVQNALSRVGAFIPALLTWHFTDYVYHSSHDTLDKISAQEMHNVATVSAAVAYQMANGGEVEATDTISQVMKSWETRLAAERANTVRHYDWMLANPGNDQADSSYERELKVFGDWSRWYIEAVQSAANLMVGGRIGMPYIKSPAMQAAEDAAIAKIQADTRAALDYVDGVFGKASSARPKQIASATLPKPILVTPGKYANLAALAAAELPSKIAVEYVGGGTGEASVTWNAVNPTFDSAREGLYRVTGTLSDIGDGVVNWAVLLAVANVNSFNLESKISIVGPDSLMAGDIATYTFLGKEMPKNASAVNLTIKIENTFFTEQKITGLDGWAVSIEEEWIENGDYSEKTLMLTRTGGGDFGDCRLFDLELAIKDGANGVTTVENVSVNAATPSERFDIGLAGSVTTEVSNFSRFDVNRSGFVDLADVAAAAYFYGARRADPDWLVEKTFEPLKIAPVYADVNGDGVVDVEDIILILNNYT